MSDVIPVSPEIWKLAAAILTAKQLCVLDLRERHGYSWNQLAISLNCTRSNVKEHHRAATKNLLDVIEAAGGDVDLALERVHSKQQLDWMNEMERTEKEVFPDSRPRGEVVVKVETNREAFAREDAALDLVKGLGNSESGGIVEAADAKPRPASEKEIA